VNSIFKENRVVLMGDKKLSVFLNGGRGFAQIEPSIETPLQNY
jgi:hypothetical protein